MKHKKSAFKESLLSLPFDSRHVQTGATPGHCHVQIGATPGQTVASLCFDVDVLRCVTLFLTNILHLKPFEKYHSPKFAEKALFCYSEMII